MSKNNKKNEFSYISALIHFMVFFLYTVIYLFLFNKIESRTGEVHIISLPFDNLIPFVEVFVVPYIMWFFYIIYFIFFYLKRDLTEYYRMGSFLASGMTIFVIISVIFPNGLLLRPNLHTIGRDNIFIDLIKGLYEKDTSTNVFPSIHVFNTIGIMLSAHYSRARVYFKKIQLYIVDIIGISIILSTMFIKQHSIVDVIGAFILSYIFYKCFYNEKYTVFVQNIGFYGTPSRKELFLKTPNGDIL